MSNMPGWDRGDGGFPLRPTQLKVNYMSDLKDFELGGYHNAGGGMTGEAMAKPSVDEVEAMANWLHDHAIDLRNDGAWAVRAIENSEKAAAMLRQQGESYRMLTAVYNRFVDGRALSVDAIQRHDFTGQDAQRNSQDGNSVVLSADEWDAYRADLNTYSQILALLGMEEEGDPVLAVKLLMQVKHD
jgi:hypothetical protein